MRGFGWALGVDFLIYEAVWGQAVLAAVEECMVLLRWPEWGCIGKASCADAVDLPEHVDEHVHGDALEYTKRFKKAENESSRSALLPTRGARLAHSLYTWA